MNGNFSEVKTAVDDNHNRVAELETQNEDLQAQLDAALELIDAATLSQPKVVKYSGGSHNFDGDPSAEIDLPAIEKEEFDKSSFKVELITGSGNHYIVPGRTVSGIGGQYGEYMVYVLYDDNTEIPTVIVRHVDGPAEGYQDIQITRIVPGESGN